MGKYSDEFIEETLRVWQPYYQEELTEEDAIEIINNMTDFINLLLKWKREDEKR